MSGNPADFRVEILRYPFGSAATEDPVDLTQYLLRENLGKINRALDRDLLSFKTGDVTMSFRNDDGKLDDVFAFFGPSDRWQLRLYRRGEIQFHGSMIGQGSITFNRRRGEEACEVTAYGLTRHLQDTSAESVRRTFTLATLTGAHAIGATALNVNSTASLLPKDVIHLRNAAQSKTEDVTIKYVNSSTQVTLVAGLVNAYSNGDVAECTTPYYRSKTIRWLVEQLLTGAGVPLADYRTSRSTFRTAGPTPISHGGLGIAQEIHSPAAERNGRAYVVLDATGTYYQPTNDPSADWVQEDGILRPWVDWSRYRKQTDSAPNIILRFPDVVGSVLDEWLCAVDDRDPTTKYVYRARSAVGPAYQMQRNGTTDGTTWTGWADFGAAGPTPGAPDITAIEFDPVRGQCYVQASTGGIGGNIGETVMYDLGLNSWSVVLNGSPQADGLRYIPERDYVLGSYEAAGGARIFVAYRNGMKVFERAAGLPTYIRLGTAVAAGSGYPYVTLGARYLDGTIYFIALYDNAVCQVSSADDFVTAKVRKIIPGSLYSGGAWGSRVADAMYWFPNSAGGVTDRAYHASASFYAGVIGYADFEGKSCAEALKALSVVTNALFWVDDDGQGHFVARDLYDPGQVIDITDLLLDETEDIIWDETVQYVEVSGAASAVSGDKAFAASGVSIDSPFIANEAFAQALADAFQGYYVKARRVGEGAVLDLDGHIFRPLDRVIVRGILFLVYESDHDEIGDEIALKRLEDVA